MKTKRTIASILAAVMAFSALPILSVNAADTAVLGDVDGDGVITGHDAALVSRSLYEDSFDLTTEQAARADINQDGVVDQADADQIHASEVYGIGDIYHKNDERGPIGVLDGAAFALFYYGVSMAGQPVEVVQKDIDNLNPWGHPTVDSVFEDMLDNVTDDMRQECQIDQVTFNMLDANADGVVDINDSFALLCAYSYEMAAQGFFSTEGRYDLYMGCRPTT